jgi:hypothetical protein
MRGNLQHFVRQHKGMVKQFWQGIPADLRARKPNAKTAKNNSEHRINLMLKCSSAHLHTTSYIVRILAKTCNRFKRASIREYATVRTATPADFGVKCSVLVLHPCISNDGIVLAPNRETMRTTYALRSKTSQRTNTHQIHKLTNKSYLDTGPNSHVLALETPSPNLPAMADKKIKAVLAPCLQGIPDDPHEDPRPYRHARGATPASHNALNGRRFSGQLEAKPCSQNFNHICIKQQDPQPTPQHDYKVETGHQDQNQNGRPNSMHSAHISCRGPTQMAMPPRY